MSLYKAGPSKAIQLIKGNPGYFLPHLKVRTLLDLPIPIGPSLPTKPKIRALVLDKDNTLCPPNTTFIHPAYREAIKLLKQSEEFSHHPDSILIVSNSVGKTASSKHEHPACELEDKLGIPVFRQYLAVEGKKKPAIGPHVANFLHMRGVISRPDEIVVVGDRFSTNVYMARLMKSWSVLLDDGWRDPHDPNKSYHDIWTKLERFMFYKFSKNLWWDEDDRALLPGEALKDKSNEEIDKEMRARNKKWREKDDADSSKKL